MKSYELFEADGAITRIPLASFATKKEWKLKLYGSVDNTPTTIILAAGSQWLDASTLIIKQLDAYSVYGATLLFRIKAVEDKNPYSAVAKMKIAKKANPPKVTIDYSKLTIKITDKME